MEAKHGTSHRPKQRNDNSVEDIPRERRVRGIPEERWPASVRANAEQEELARQPEVRDPLAEPIGELPDAALDGRAGHVRGDPEDLTVVRDAHDVRR